jgi:methylated-DNA-[protein]-cysteine S-methyltransferase
LADPNAARAVGNALAANPIPLIVPCHRVIRTDGGLGGFSAPGGTATKQRMLRHERSPANPK